MIKQGAQVLLILVLLAAGQASFAQVRARNTSPARAEAYTLRATPGNIVADGDLSDWGDTLTHYHEEGRLFYRISNDADNLYFIFRTKPEGHHKVFLGGISVSAFADARSKEKPTVTFPILDRAPRTQAEEEAGNRNQEILSRIKVIRVSAFREILDGDIARENSYGIRAGAAFDKSGSFTQEIKIPLRLLQLSEYKGELIYHIRINGISRPPVRPVQQSNQRGMPPGMYGRPFPMAPQIDKALAPIDIYFKGPLSGQ